MRYCAFSNKEGSNVWYFFRDRFRTTINVVCDALGAIIVASLSQGDLDNEKSRVAENDRELAQAQELTELEKGTH